MDLSGKVAIVTGASRGVGAATAELLARRGCKIACAARATDNSPLPIPGTIDDTVRRITAAGGEAITFPGDLALEMKRFDLVMQVDLRAPLIAIRAATPAMKEQGEGAIVNVSSVAGLNYFPGLMAYG